MQCSACGAGNRENRRFCAACGAALPCPCPACGFANDADDRFCGGCGAMLRPGAAAAAGIRHHRAEMISRLLVGMVATDLGDRPRALEESSRSLALARRLGANSFEAEALCHLARLAIFDGDRSQGCRLAQEALAILRRSGMSFFGPYALGALAADDARQRREARAAFGRGGRQPALLAELSSLCRQAEQVGLRSAMPALQQAASAA